MKFIFAFLSVAGFLAPLSASAQMDAGLMVTMTEPPKSQIYETFHPLFENLQGQWSAAEAQSEYSVYDSSTKALVKAPSAPLTNLKVSQVEENTWNLEFSICDGTSCAQVISYIRIDGENLYICPKITCESGERANLNLQSISEHSVKWSQVFLFAPNETDGVKEITSITEFQLLSDNTLQLQTTMYADNTLENLTKITFSRNIKLN